MNEMGLSKLIIDTRTKINDAKGKKFPFKKLLYRKILVQAKREAYRIINEYAQEFIPENIIDICHAIEVAKVFDLEPSAEHFFYQYKYDSNYYIGNLIVNDIQAANFGLVNVTISSVISSGNPEPIKIRWDINEPSKQISNGISKQSNRSYNLEADSIRLMEGIETTNDVILDGTYSILSDMSRVWVEVIFEGFYDKYIHHKE